MSFTTAFTITQGGDITQCAINDTSSYLNEAKGSFSARTVIIYKADGTVFRGEGQTTDIINFPFGMGDTLTVRGLDKDYAFSVLMNHIPIVGQGGSTYSKTNTQALTGYTMTAFYNRQKQMQGNIRYEKDIVFTNDTHKIYVFKKAAEQSASEGDLSTAQIALDKAKRIVDVNTLPY